MTTVPAVSEAQLQDCVIEMAQRFGWKIHHGRPGMNRRGEWMTPIQGDAGFPDLIMARAGRTLAVELKSEKGRVADAQYDWLKVLDETTVSAYLWRPRDWFPQNASAQSLIERVLR